MAKRFPGYFSAFFTVAIAFISIFAFQDDDSEQFATIIPEIADSRKGVYKNEGKPFFQHKIIAQYTSGKAHSPSLIEHKDGALQAIWFYGESEAHNSVGLDSARFLAGQWSKPVTILSAKNDRLDRGFFVNTIGNPVLMAGPAGKVWLFYVTPSLGGWSSSRLSLRQSDDGGKTWSGARLLQTAPFFNMSTLARFRGQKMTNGYFTLPAYHELANKFPEMLVLDASGYVVDKRRIGSGGNNGIQGAMIMLDGQNGLMFVRSVKSMPNFIHLSKTLDGGLNWTAPAPTELESRDSPACAALLPTGDIVLGYNPGVNRNRLRFMLYNPGSGRWTSLGSEIGGELANDSISYCSMITDGQGVVELVFSKFSTRTIEFVRFNLDWIYKARI